MQLSVLKISEIIGAPTPPDVVVVVIVSAERVGGVRGVLDIS